MEKKKNTYLAIITIITVVAIVAGSIYHIGGAIYDFGSFLGGNIGHGSEEESAGGSGKADFSESYIDVKEIYIECAMSKVVIEDGDKCEVDYDGIKDLEPKVNLDSDGRLYIKQDKEIKAKRMKNSKSELVIRVPEDGVKKLNIELAMGDLQIDGIKSDDLHVEAAAGDVKADDIVTESIDLEAAMGNIDVLDTVFSDLTAEAAMGNITIESERDLSGYDIEAEAALGNINISGEKVSGKGGLNRSATGDRIGSITLECALGNINLQ